MINLVKSRPLCLDYLMGQNVIGYDIIYFVNYSDLPLNAINHNIYLLNILQTIIKLQPSKSIAQTMQAQRQQKNKRDIAKHTHHSKMIQKMILSQFPNNCSYVGSRFQNMDRKNKPSAQLHMHIQSMRAQSFGLMDYNQHNKNNKFKTKLCNIPLSDKFIFFRKQKNHEDCNGFKIQVTKQNQSKYQQDNIIVAAHIYQQNNIYYVQIIPKRYIINQSNISTNYQSLIEQPFIIVRSLKCTDKNAQIGVQLRSNQIIKFGKAIYKVLSVSSEETEKFVSQDMLSPNQNIFIYQEQQNLTQEDTCRICLGPQNNQDEDYLISPCKCDGSSRFVHFSCLEHWMQLRVQRTVVQGAYQYNFKKFECEICKSELPRYIKIKGNILQLMPICKPQGDYVILQGLSPQANSLIVLNEFPPEGIKLGRSTNCQILMQEMSVSRSHSTIRKIGNYFFIFDNRSKYGSLISMEGIVFELSEMKRAIQIGSVTIAFQIKIQDLKYELYN